MVDTMIRLFDSTATSFVTNGLGSLPDASKCEVTEERNGSFELEMEYHISGKRYSDLGLRKILVAKPNPYAKPQPFRIYEISKPIGGLVTVKAEHISYDMSGYPVGPFMASGLTEALAGLKKNAIVESPFIFEAKTTSEKEVSFNKYASMRSLLGGMDGSILDVYGGEFEFDGYRAILHESRGDNRGVTIRYGKNMTDLKQEENCSEVYTAVCPFWRSDEWGIVDLPEKTVPAPGTYDYVRVYPLDLSSEWENTYEFVREFPSEDEIRDLAKKYIADHNIGVPKVSLSVSFEMLSQAKEYEALKALEAVRLCDTVNVEFPELNVSASSKCIKTTYDVLTGKYVSIELGEAKSNLADAIVSQNSAVDKKLEERPTKPFVEQTVSNATSLITGGLGGYVVMRSSREDGRPDEILIMDTDDIETASKVWRWNKGGLGYSSNGYGGPYETAITQGGEIVADFIKAGSLTANVIQGGTLTVGGTGNADGTIEVKDSMNRLLLKLGVDGISFFNDGKEPVTRIIDDTVTTEFINALHVAAGSVDAENITGEVISGKTIHGGVIKGAELISEGENYISEISSGEIKSTLYRLLEPKSGDGYLPGLVKLNASQDTVTNGLYLEDDESHLTKPLYVTRDAGGTATVYPYVGILSGGRIYSDGAICPDDDGEHPCGAANYRWSTVYAKNGEIDTSDRNEKHDIQAITKVYEKLFFQLKPVSFLFNDGDRVHMGIIAQDLKEAMDALGLSEIDVAAFCRDVKMKAVKDESTGRVTEKPDLDEDGNVKYSYGVRYSEFIMLTVHMLQKAYGLIEAQQKEIDRLKTKLEEVLTYIKEKEGSVK